MSVPAGTRFGPYEILAPLGKGGMGEVYEARDTRLDRAVAVKVLPPEFADSAERRARFEREAKTISQLNHPHICRLYDVGEADGRPYLVMELLDGESLARRLLRGPLPLPEVLQAGIEICEALDRAHRAGIVHRDLKPANIMLTASGAKLLDFGLARASQIEMPAASSAVLTETAIRPLTAERALVGTLQYMAPEQFEGRADARSDIFALGCVLYEMATGKPAFDGKSQATIMAAVLTGEPARLGEANLNAPPLFESVVETALRKSPEARWQSAADVRLLLQEIAANSASASRAVAAKRRRVLGPVITALSVLIALGALFVAWQGVTRARSRGPIRTQIVPPSGALFDFNVTGAPPEISPDGQKVVFGATSGGRSVLFVRDLAEPSARLLVGTDNATYPFWSADSRWIGFFADRKLKKVEWSGGSIEILADAPDARGGTWGRDGTILFGQRGGPILRLPPGQQRTTPATALAPPYHTHRWPRLLPDGRHFLFLAAFGGGEDVRNQIVIASLDHVDAGRTLVAASSQPLFFDGQLLFVRDQVLNAQRLNVEAARLEGEALAVEPSSIAYDPLFARAMVSISDTGTLLYQPGAVAGNGVLTWFDRQGKVLGRVGPPAPYRLLAISPDESRIAYSLGSRGSDTEMWVADLKSGGRTRVITGAHEDNWPVWSSDGRRLLFQSLGGPGKRDIRIWDRETGLQQSVLNSPDVKWPGSWSADGRVVLYSVRTERGIDLHYLTLDDGRDHVYLATATDESMARISPDGHWVAYMSFENRWQIYIAPFPFTGPKWLVPLSGATLPVWRADGRELFFVSAAGTKLYSVSVGLGKSVSLGEPQPLFDFRPATALPVGYDVSADGQRFLINTKLDEEPPAPLTVVQNFGAEMQRLVAARR